MGLKIASVLSLISCDGWNLLLKPHIEEQVKENMEALTQSKGKTPEEEMARVQFLRAKIESLRGLINEVEIWVQELNEKQGGD